MVQERPSSEHQPSKPRGGRQQPAMPARLIYSPNAKSPPFFLVARFPPKFPGFSLQLEEMRQTHRLRATCPLSQEGDLPGAAVPGGTDGSPAAAGRAGGKSLNPDPQGHRVPLTPTVPHRPEKKQPGPCSGVRIMKVLVEKSSAFANPEGAMPCPWPQVHFAVASPSLPAAV